jgi:hypothetical protein
MPAARSGPISLARKYQTLCELRRDSAPFDPRLLRQLASEFPGALRELDGLPLAELDRRLAAARAAERGSQPEPWLGWMLAYHRRMRLCLRIKQRLTLAADSGESAASLAGDVARELAEPCDAELVARVARPPRGRMNLLVFELLERELGRSKVELESALFPRLARRAS